MSISLRDQLLGLGYQPAPKPERPAPGQAVRRPEHRPERRPDDGPRNTSEAKPSPRRRPDAGDTRRNDRQLSPAAARPQPSGVRPARTREEIDLGRAYALRAQKEKDERIEAERLKQEQARLRRESKERLAVLLKDQALNAADGDIARHFEYGGKIKRIHVTAAQLQALNGGELGVAQMQGRYLLIPAALLLQAEAIFPEAVALKVDPNAPASADPYSDPTFQVPDDLIW